MIFKFVFSGIEERGSDGRERKAERKLGNRQDSKKRTLILWGKKRKNTILSKKEVQLSMGKTYKNVLFACKWL